MRRKLRLQMNSEKEIKAAAHRAIMAEKQAVRQKALNKAKDKLEKHRQKDPAIRNRGATWNYALTRQKIQRQK